MFDYLPKDVSVLTAVIGIILVLVFGVGFSFLICVGISKESGDKGEL